MNNLVAITIEQVDADLVAELAGCQPGVLPLTIPLAEDVSIALEVAARPHGLFPVENEAIRLLVEIPTAVGVGVFANWLWHRIRTRTKRILVERQECTVITEEDLHRVIYERWRMKRHGD